MLKKNIIILIPATITLLLASQVYWVYQYYKIKKSEVIVQVEESLDTSIKEYYKSIAKTLSISDLIENIDTEPFNVFVMDSLPKNTNFITKIDLNIENELNSSNIHEKDSVYANFDFNLSKPSQHQSNSIEIRNSKNNTLSISYKSKELKLATLDSLLIAALEKKNLSSKYQITSIENRFSSDSIIKTIGDLQIKSHKITSKSNLLPEDTVIEIHYPKIINTTLLKIIWILVLSTIITGLVSFILLFLYRSLKKQKQLSEVKNDIISNITHEFKTPIASISVALESLEHFGTLNNPELTKKYIKNSSLQLKKLNAMVEKLLESATIDKEELILNLEEIDIVPFIHKITTKYKQESINKSIIFNHDKKSLLHSIDPFHFENILNNLLENAIKYGGNKILVELVNKDSNIELIVADNGKGIDKIHHNKIFSKFYRVPTGNTHNTKGYGIGLYYVQKILEKHDSIIQLMTLKEYPTAFKITLNTIK